MNKSIEHSKRIIKSGQPMRLFKEINDLYSYLRLDMNNNWDRDLPFEELLFNRWERGTNLNFGTKTSIYHNSYIYGKPKIGKNCWIGPYTIIDATGGLIIGDNCDISCGVHIYTHDTYLRALSGGKEPIKKKSVSIANNCFIGANTVIIKGITIGHHSVIGAQSFVNKNIPPYSIAVGNPIKIVGKVKFNKNKISLIYSKSS